MDHALVEGLSDALNGAADYLVHHDIWAEISANIVARAYLHDPGYAKLVDPDNSCVGAEGVNLLFLASENLSVELFTQEIFQGVTA